MQAVRAVSRFRWVLPAFGIPLCIVALGIAVQAAAFPRPASETLVATDALRALLRYHVMQGIEQIGRRSVASTCVDGSFRVPARRRPLRGAFVLLGDGERLYNLGNGIRRAGRRGPVGPVDRARFVLAGCPSFLGQGVITSLVYDIPVDADPVRTHRAQDLAIDFGPSYRPIHLLVRARSFRPVAVTLGGRVRGSSRLELGASEAAIMRVRRAFDLGRQAKIRGV